MARVAFDIDEKTKREIRVRLAKEGKTLSEAMRILCLHYKDFGLRGLGKFIVMMPEPRSEDGNEIPHSQGDMRHCTITLYLDEKKTTKLSDLAASTGRTKSELIGFLIDWTCPSIKRGDIIVDRNGNDTPQDN